VADDLIHYPHRIYFNTFLVERIVAPLMPGILRRRGWRVAPVEDRRPAEGPFLVAAHHESISDILAFHKLMLRQGRRYKLRRRVFWLADNRPFGRALPDVPIVRWFVKRTGMIPIDKYRPERNANVWDYLLFLLESGEGVGFFPEGEIQSDRGGRRFGPFKTGVVRLAALYEAKHGKPLPIIPIGLHYERKPGERLGEIRIRVGDPIYCEQGDVEACHRKLVARILELSAG
jgi:1-acyl-sn-glycerol-3-phosphate acyltransferase